MITTVKLILIVKTIMMTTAKMITITIDSDHGNGNDSDNDIYSDNDSKIIMITTLKMITTFSITQLVN